MRHPDRLIPVAKLPEGLGLCAQNIRDFIVDAATLLSKGHGWHAIALAIFAFEELGKYAELRRIKESSKNAHDVRVKDALFRSHDYKQELARQVVPSDSIILLPKYFGDKYFDSEFFGTENVTITPNLRAECAFVDWVDGDWLDRDWRIGTPHDTEQLKKFLDAVLDALNKLETKT